MAMRHCFNQALAAATAPPRPCHIRFGPGLVDENQTFRFQRALTLAPVRPGGGNVGTVLFRCPDGLFLYVTPSRPNSLCNSASLALTPWVASNQARNSAKVASGTSATFAANDVRKPSSLGGTWQTCGLAERSPATRRRLRTFET
jgi:hypothetical protein